MTTHSQPAELAEHETVDEPDAEPTAVTPTPLLTRVGAELVGTFVLVTAILVVAGFGSIGANATSLYVALAAGLALTVMVATFGSVSGGHFNPAVSLGAAIAGRLAWIDLAPYIVAQVVGGIGAAAVLRTVTPADLPTALGLTDLRAFLSTAANGFGDHSPLATASQGAVTFTTMQALVIEAVATAILVGVVLAVTRRPNPFAPAAIGGALTVGTLIAAQATNAALNPARATGAALFSESWAFDQLWLFWVAPIFGGLMAGLIVAVFQPVEVIADAEADEDDDDWDEEDDSDDWNAHHAVPETSAVTGHAPDGFEADPDDTESDEADPDPSEADAAENEAEVDESDDAETDEPESKPRS